MFINQILEWARDKFTNFLTWITSDHRYIHEGKGFSLIDDTGSIAAAGAYSFAFTTPDKTVAYVHLRPAKYLASANITTFTIAEGSTVTGGSAVTPINLNRNSKKTSKMTWLKGVTVSAAGTTIFRDTTGLAGGPSSSTGGGDKTSEERVLKPNTTYSVTFANIGSVTASTSYFDIFWYEEDVG